jgi:hypothetical protein
MPLVSAPAHDRPLRIFIIGSVCETALRLNQVDALEMHGIKLFVFCTRADRQRFGCSSKLHLLPKQPECPGSPQQWKLGRFFLE